MVINALYEGINLRKMANAYAGHQASGYNPKAGGDELMRKVKAYDHIIELYELYPENYPKNASHFRNYVGYRLLDPAGNVIFQGNDLSPSPGEAIDGDGVIRSLLGFLTMGEHDTDDEYFERYTPQQLRWRDEHAENLSIYSMEPEVGEEDAYSFEEYEEPEA